MPARPDQHDEATLARWAHRKRALGARLRELRLARGLTQESVALESGISRNQIIAIEWGRSSIATERLFDLADALGVQAQDLLVEASEEPIPEQYRGGRSRRSVKEHRDPM